MNEILYDEKASSMLLGMPPVAAKGVTPHLSKPGFAYVNSVDTLVWLMDKRKLSLMGKPEIQAYWLESLNGNAHVNVYCNIISRMVADGTLKYVGSARYPTGDVQKYELTQNGKMLAEQVEAGRELEAEIKPKIEMNRPAPWARPVAPATAPVRSEGASVIAHELRQIRLVLEELVLSNQKLAIALTRKEAKASVKEKPVTVPVEKKKRGRPRKSA